MKRINRTNAGEHADEGSAVRARRGLLATAGARFRKQVVAVGLTGALLVVVAGCATTPTPVDADPTAQPIDKPVAAGCPTAGDGPWGDVIASEEVTDEFGTYCHTTIDPNADALKFDESKVDKASLEEHGFTIDEAEAAQKVVVTFLAEQGLDSSRLDSDEFTDADWLETNRDLLSTADQFEGTSLIDAGLLVAGYLPKPIVRNGGPRSEEVGIQVNKIYATASKAGTNLIIVDTGVSAKYSASNETIVQLIVDNNSERTTESVIVDHPELAVPSNDSGLLLQGTFTYSVKEGSPGQIAGSRAGWRLGTKDGVPVAE